MGKRERTLDEITDVPKKVVFPPDDMIEFKTKLEQKFGEFSLRGLHRFYAKAGIAKVAWGVKRGDTVEKLPFGKILAIYEYPSMKGNKVWKGYTLATEHPYTFWEDLYWQTCKHLAKTEFVEQKKLEGLEAIAKTVGKDVYEDYE